VAVAFRIAVTQNCSHVFECGPCSPMNTPPRVTALLSSLHSYFSSFLPFSSLSSAFRPKGELWVCSLLSSYISSSPSPSAARVIPSGLFPIRVNLELRILWTVRRTPRMGDQPHGKVATYTRRYHHRNNAELYVWSGFEPTYPVF
jgi:hypothetical protein